MATSDFLPFATNFAANVETQANWITNPAAVNGFAAGVARSRECNKAWRQPSFMSAAWGRLTADTLDEDCLDDGNVPRLVDQLSRMVSGIAINTAEVREAPGDGLLYGRRVVAGIGQWARVTDEALLDNNTYGRRNGQWVVVPQLSDLNSYLRLAGGTMTGFITLHANPVNPMHAATRGWVLTEIAGSMSASGFVPEAPPSGGPWGRQGNTWVQVLSTGQMGGYLPLTGGWIRRADGGSDPLGISVAWGQYSRITYSVDATRTWSAGVGWDGTWMVADESIGVVRQQQDGSGFFNLTSDGGTSLRLSSRAYNNDNYINILGGNTNWLIGPQGGQGRLIFYNGGYAMMIHNNGTVQAGWDLVTPSAVYTPTAYIGGIALYNYSGWLHTPSSFWGGDLRSNSNVYAPNGWIDAGGNITGWDLYARSWLNGGYIHSRGDAGVAGRLTCGDFQSNGNVYAPWGWVSCGHHVECGSLNVRNAIWTDGSSIQVRWDGWCWGGWGCGGTNTHNATIALDGGYNPDWTYYGAGIQLRAGDAVKPGDGPWGTWSDRRLKREVNRYTRGLDAIIKLNPTTYCYNELFGELYNCGEAATRHTLGQTYVGLDADEVEPVMPEMIREEPASRLASRRIDGPPVKIISAGPLTYALVNAVKELADRVATLEKRS